MGITRVRLGGLGLSTSGVRSLLALSTHLRCRYKALVGHSWVPRQAFVPFLPGGSGMVVGEVGGQTGGAAEEEGWVVPEGARAGA